LSSTVSKRHNKAGTAIVTAIRAGTKGATLIAADVGLHVHSTDEAEHSALPRTIPLNLLPKTMPLTVKQRITRASIPDIFMYEEVHTNDQRKYTIVEIKYCRDTRQEEQEARANQQHATMHQLIQQYDPSATIEYYVIMLGVSGVLYEATIKCLSEQLGIQGPTLAALLTKLHHIAVEGLGKAWKHRRMLINHLPGMKGKGKWHRHRAPPHRKTRKKRATKR
jgi:hypothetical protein